MSITDLKLNVETPNGRKARIIASGLVDREARIVTLAHGFGNRGAAVSYLRQNEPMLLDERGTGCLTPLPARIPRPPGDCSGRN